MVSEFKSAEHAHQNSTKRNSERNKQKKNLLSVFAPPHKGLIELFFFACTQKIFAVNLVLMKDARLIALGTEILCTHRQSTE